MVLESPKVIHPVPSAPPLDIETSSPYLGQETLRILGSFFSQHPVMAISLSVVMIWKFSSIIKRIQNIFSRLKDLLFPPISCPEIPRMQEPYVYAPLIPNENPQVQLCPPLMPDGSSSSTSNPTDGITPPLIPVGAESFRNPSIALPPQMPFSHRGY